MRRIGLKNKMYLDDKNIGSIADATRTDGRTEGWTERIIKGRVEKVRIFPFLVDKITITVTVKNNPRNMHTILSRINVEPEEVTKEFLYRKYPVAENGDQKTYPCNFANHKTLLCVYFKAVIQY